VCLDGVIVGLVESVREREKGETQKTCFSVVRAVCVHYFKYIQKTALQSDCVMLFGGSE